MYNQHTRGMETTWHRSLVERGGRKALLETLHTHTQKKKIRNKTDIHEFKRKYSITYSFQQSYSTISYEVIKATSIKYGDGCIMITEDPSGPSISTGRRPYERWCKGD